jgi:hypothetical protein
VKNAIVFKLFSVVAIIPNLLRPKVGICFGLNLHYIIRKIDKIIPFLG